MGSADAGKGVGSRRIRAVRTTLFVYHAARLFIEPRSGAGAGEIRAASGSRLRGAPRGQSGRSARLAESTGLLPKTESEEPDHRSPTPDRPCPRSGASVG